ncbi:hypothetical protein TURU_080008 [Turdus rufiventris]|nr:hypothetical protein TURU_080008 [Turdus rufiventris]
MIFFYDKVTCLVVEAKPVDVYLNFTKAFDNVSHSILIEKLTAYILDGCKNWLAGWPREGWAMSPKGKETREDLESDSCGGWPLLPGNKQQDKRKWPQAMPGEV